MTYDAKEEVAASDITPTLRTNASSANPMVERSCDLIRPPLVAPTTLRVFSPLMRKGTEAMAKLMKLMTAMSITAMATVSRTMVVERLPLPATSVMTSFDQ